jgi:2-oxoglutarate dehydrogenase E1 component
MIGHSYLSNADVSSIEALYEQYQIQKDSVDFGWQKFFEGFDLAQGLDGTESKVVSDGYAS